MAKSPAHQFGQIIGDILEISIESILENFARENQLYLDKKGSRSARKGKKVSWVDLYGNQHDLDFVLENAGSDTQIGTPVAFIETAWRRYTKHSRNKAQEIQGAILPLVAAHQNAAPFIGVILAGCFTENSLNQLHSLGFTIAYFPYNTIIQSFEFVGINAYFDEKTPDAEFVEKVSRCQTLPRENYINIANKLVELNSDVVAKFITQLRYYITRKITSIKVCH
ncbi:hypothetical protein [Okeania sp.]|uniref:hypothetical protein n=1 Tax=Okeania sp. TaxID=3100323 RepID=UPI002B4B5DA1|nr:hypothetical protein [Okeania sp.]MEB3342531.1 hypothetical protein [Okeania sp.]